MEEKLVGLEREEMRDAVRVSAKGSGWVKFAAGAGFALGVLLAGVGGAVFVLSGVWAQEEGVCEDLWEQEGMTVLARHGSGVRFVEEQFRQDARLVKVRSVVFREGEATLRVAAPRVPQEADFAEFLRQSGALAGVNGGYFHAGWKPIGLVVSGGDVVHPVERARLLTGFLVVRKNRVALVRGTKLGLNDVDEALQSGPFLVDGGVPVSGLEALKSARRTFVATDGKGMWAVGVMSACTLREAGLLLSRSRVFGVQGVQTALNLDGGSSTGLWVRGGGAEGGDFLLSPLTPVANFVGVYAIGSGEQTAEQSR